MTLPFENDTSAAIKRLAKRSLWSEKRRNSLLVLTIALAALVMAAVQMAILSTGAMQQNMAQDTYEAIYPGITREQGQALLEQPEVQRVGMQYSLATQQESTGATVSIGYGDEAALYGVRHQLQLVEVILVVALAGGMVIRSMFRISILEKIQSYGQLRTLGATSKQVKRILKRETRILCAIAIPIGVLVGIVAGSLFATNFFTTGFSWKVAWVVALVTAVACYAMVMLSARKPVQIAAHVSPIQAVKMESWNKVTGQMTGKYRRFSPLTYAVCSIRRDGKRAASVLISLSFGGILLVLAASVFASYSPKQHAKAKFPYGQIRLYLQDDQMDLTTQMRQASPFTSDLQQTILQIKGVDQVRTLRRSVGECNIEAENGGGDGVCDVLSGDGYSLEGDWQYAQQHLAAGRMPEKDDEILVHMIYANNPEYQSMIHLGEKVNLTVGEQTRQVTVVGIYDTVGSGNGIYGMDSASVMVTEGLARQMVQEMEQLDYTWVVSTQPGMERSVLEELQAVVDAAPSGIGIYTYEQELAFLTFQHNVIFGGLQGLSWMIFLFGVVNLVNTTLSSHLSRWREFSIMRAVGMTEKQLCWMLTVEGLFYILGSALVALCAGIPLSIWVCRWLGQAMLGQVLEYRFPFGVMALYTGLLMLLEWILTLYTMKKQQKRSLVHQIRGME